MQSITECAQQMTEIISLIDGIAFQTNILALNAAVEAAGRAIMEKVFLSLRKRSETWHTAAQRPRRISKR
jgi:hypothetical protein